MTRKRLNAELNKVYEHATHVLCKCGGLIGSWDRIIFSCDKCHREYRLFELDYDVLIPNPLTGHEFPMKIKEDVNEN